MSTAPNLITCYAADTSGTDNGAEPISIAATAIEVFPDGGLVVRAHFDGLQEPVNPISAEASAIHGLTNDDVVGHEFDLDALDAILDPARAVLSWGPRFDMRMFKQFRLKRADLPWHQMRLKDGEHTGPPNAPADGISRARRRVDHMVECLRSKTDTEPTRTWLDSVLAQPALEPPRIADKYILSGNVRFARVFHRNLGACDVGEHFSLWTQPQIGFISAYIKSTGGVAIFNLEKADNPRLAAQVARGGRSEGTIIVADGLHRVVHIIY